MSYTNVLLALTEQTETQLVFYCPGCKCGHSFRVRTQGDEQLPVWEWNQDMVKPTFSPSLLVNGSIPEGRCHSFVRNGMIEFLGDCHHSLRGQTVALPTMTEEW